MKITSFIFVIAVFASPIVILPSAVMLPVAWTPSAEEVALSAKEDARELALYTLVAK
jgi:hypothetical protein